MHTDLGGGAAGKGQKTLDLNRIGETPGSHGTWYCFVYIPSAFPCATFTSKFSFLMVARWLPETLDLSPTLSAARAESEHLFFPTVSTKVPGLSPLGAEWAWRYGLSVKWPPYVHLFEHLVPSWATLSREVVEPLGDGASLEEAGQWGGGRALGLQPDPSSCPVSASCSTEI